MKSRSRVELFCAPVAAFNIGLGLTVANAFAGRAAARDRANQTYNQALIANQSAEADKRQKQLGFIKLSHIIYIIIHRDTPVPRKNIIFYS